MSWALAAFSLELRKALAYRANVWVNFVGSVLTELAMAYFLWSAIYAARGLESLGGYSLHAMMLYYLFIPLVSRITRGEEYGQVSVEIYDGTLTRYLLFPVSFLAYKYLTHLANASFGLVQLGLALGAFLLLFGSPADRPVTAAAVAGGLLASVVASYLYFCLVNALEMAAFWAENVWSLQVMLRFLILFFGGGLVPLSLYPEWLRAPIELSPFPYLMSFPIQAFMGELAPAAFARGLGLIAFWSLAATLLARAVWARGLRSYTGVGI